MKIKLTAFWGALAFCLSCQQNKPIDTNTKSASTIKNVSTTEAAQFKVIESAYNLQSGFGDNFLKWTVVIENPNQDAYGLFPTVTITARDEDGTVVGTEDQVLKELPPGIKMARAGQMTVTKPPKTVEITPLKVEWRNTETKSADYLTFQANKINVSLQGKNLYKVTGDITNPYEKEIDQIAVVVLLRNEDGKLMGGGTGFVDTLSAKSSRPFSVDYIATKEKVQKAEVFAFPWGQVSWNNVSGLK